MKTLLVCLVMSLSLLACHRKDDSPSIHNPFPSGQVAVVSGEWSVALDGNSTHNGVMSLNQTGIDITGTFVGDEPHQVSGVAYPDEIELILEKLSSECEEKINVNAKIVDDSHMTFNYSQIRCDETTESGSGKMVKIQSQLPNVAGNWEARTTVRDNKPLDPIETADLKLVQNGSIISGSVTIQDGQSGLETLPISGFLVDATHLSFYLTKMNGDCRETIAVLATLVNSKNMTFSYSQNRCDNDPPTETGSGTIVKK